MISLRPVNLGNLDTLFNLAVHPAQKGLVTPNPKTLAEIHYTSGGYVFAICNDDDIVGLLAMIDLREHDELLDGDDPNAAFMLRLMVGAEFQGQGFGKGAVAKAIAWAKDRGNSQFQTAYVPGNEAARRLYESFGLRETGRLIEGEIEMSLKL
ncbi:MAG: GNAT family N-acetyltransferase [Paracoccaceae bacterium]